MTDTRISRGGRIALAALVLLAGPANAQSYGPSSQVLTVGAAEFRMDDVFFSGYGIRVNGYLYNSHPHPFGLEPTYLAPLALPDGALIEEMCLYAYDSDPDVDVTVRLVAVKLTPDGESPDIVAVGPILSSTILGFGRFCASVSETVRRKLDVDGDGEDDAAAWYLRAYLRPNESPSHGLGGVRIRWRRQTSPPPSVATFGDVPTSHPFYEFVESLAASGITGGCGGGNFCPASPLTRGQMAVFLSKSLGLHWTD